jgi:dephospho-CoA kinase
MIVVGLTGGIGAGKSTVSALLAERGAVIVDADQIARDQQAPGAPALIKMAERFGDHIIDENGALDRAAVAQIVFSDKNALKDLNAIMHPAIQDEIQRQILANVDHDGVVILDFPLLGENPRRGLAGTIVVDVPYELAVRRVVEFRGMSEDDAWNRINSQMTREKRLAAATHVIDNSGSLDDLIDQVDRIWPELLRLAPTVPEAIRADARSDRADDDG